MAKKAASPPPETPATQGSSSLITEFDIYLFKSGKHYKLYEKLGAHVTELNGQKGTFFAVWAPNAQHVSIIDDFNY